MVRWDIPARGDLPPHPFYWHNGEQRARACATKSRGSWAADSTGATRARRSGPTGPGCLIVGTEGKIYATGHNATFTMLPEEKFKDVQKDRPEKVERSRGPRAGLAVGLPRRQAGLGELRLCRAAHRVQHARQRGHAVRGRRWSTTRWPARSSTMPRPTRPLARSTGKAGACEESRVESRDWGERTSGVPRTPSSRAG